MKHFVEGIAHHVPVWFFEALSKYSTLPIFKRARQTEHIATMVAQELIDNRTADMQNGIEKDDLLSILCTFAVACLFSYSHS